MENGLEILIKKFPKHGMSRDHQKFLDYALKQYFNGKQLEELRLTKRQTEFAKEIYKRLGQIKINSSRKICGVLAKHPKDLEDNAAFADALIRYSMHFRDLNKRIFKIFRKLDKEDKKSLYKRYKRDIKNTEDRYALENFANTPEIYVFAIDIILNNGR